MTIHDTAYDTLIGRNIINVGKLEKEMAKYLQDDFVFTNHAGIISDLPIIPIGLMGNCHAALKMPFFGNPLLVTSDKEQYLVMDYRPFTVPTGNSCMYTDVRIRANTEYNLAFDRQIFSLDWVLEIKNAKFTSSSKNSLSSIKVNFGYAGFIFSKWITKLMTQRFNLSPDEAHKIDIITSIYYQMLFENTGEITHENTEKLAIHTIKNTNAKGTDVTEILSQIQTLNGIDDLCSAFRTVLDNVKLENFNAAVLVTIVGNSWFGLNSKELLGVALEYPPAFIPLVFNALKEKSFKHTYLADVCSQYAKKGDVNGFLLNYRSLIDSYIDITMIKKDL